MLKSVITIFIAIIVSFHTIYGENAFPRVNDGVLDLTNMSAIDENIPLKGKWYFFADTIIPPANISQAITDIPHEMISVPSSRKETSDFTKGTYYLKIVTDSLSEELSLFTITIYSSARVFINNSLIATVGELIPEKNSYEPGLVLKGKGFYLQKGENHLVIQYSDRHREKRGLANPVILMTHEKLIQRLVAQIIKMALILGSVLFIIFNQINFYFMRRKNITSFYFGLFSFLIFIYISFMSIYFIGKIFPEINFNFQLTLKSWRIIYFFTVCFFALYIHSIFYSIYNIWFLRFVISYSFLSIILTLLLPLHLSSQNFNYFMAFTLIVAVHGLGVGIVGLVRKIEFAKLFVFGFGLFVASIVNDVLHNLLIIHSVNLVDVGLFGIMLSQSLLINTKLHRYLHSSEKLSKHLEFVNQNLEEIVQERTKQVEEHKSEIEAQRDKIIRQRDDALNKNITILKQKKTITDSINYAREIQYAVLPEKNMLQQHFRDSFILMKPKDYVSGDFYWMRNINCNGKQCFAFAVADCTGHGVPGALLSMLGVSLLNEIVNTQVINSTSELLEQLRTKFKETLSNHLKTQSSSDGMHITICVLHPDGVLDNSGAFQHFYHIRGDKATKIKGTKNIIGAYPREKPFKSNQLQLQRGDRIYLLTDGYPDQMSGSGKGRFMQRRLLNKLRLFKQVSFDNQRNFLDMTFDDWRGKSEQIDDVLILGVKY